MSTKPRDVSWAQRRRRWQERTAPSERRRRRRLERWLDWRSSCIHSRPSRRSRHATCPDTQFTTNSRLFLCFRQVLSLQSSQRAQLEESSRLSEQPMDRPAWELRRDNNDIPPADLWRRSTTRGHTGVTLRSSTSARWRRRVCSIFVCPFEKNSWLTGFFLAEGFVNLNIICIAWSLYLYTLGTVTKNWASLSRTL